MGSSKFRLPTPETGTDSGGSWVTLRNAVVRWLKKHVNLYRAWYAFGVALLAFLAYSLVSPNTLFLQLGSVVLTILALYLIMITSNRELQKATKTQADAFVSELRAVGSELRNVTNRLEGIATTLQGLKQVMERQVLTQETITAVEQAETTMRIQRMKPILYTRIQLAGWNLLLDLRQHQLLVYNSGGDAREVFASVGVAPMQNTQTRFGPFAIPSNGQTPPQNIGPTNAFGGATSFVISISCRDVERREYSGIAQVLLGADWNQVSLSPTSVS